jgi:hypothetical protein
MVVLEETAHSVATFRAIFGLVHPGLKPWAILLDHFMVKNPLAAHQTLIADY